MTARLATACVLAAITLLGFLKFPGHTYLQADTQIYVPMLERIWDPSVLPHDLVASKPHLAYTIYDEAALALRWLSRGSFESALIAQQILFRACQVLGVYLLATAIPLTRWLALGVSALAGLGATIAGPSVLLMEYEPVPRGFAIGLLFLAIGLAAHGRLALASAAASFAFLYHAPTTLPFWICFLPLVWRSRRWRALMPLAAACVVIVIASRLQPGAAEPQQFFFRLDPQLERLQRLRASYNWTGLWIGDLGWQYLAMWTLSLAAFWRLRPRRGRIFLLGLPVVGLLSLPASYLLLDRWKWGLMSQLQPARAVLFVTAIFLILSAAAGLLAAQRKAWLEGAFWLTLAVALPMRQWLLWPEPRQWWLAAALGTVLALGVRFAPVLALGALSAYVLIPTAGRVHNYAHLETADLRELESFALEHTPRDAVFLFADVGRGLQPGIFRARTLRPVYVDWKAGGQVNYYRSLAEDWWLRWERTGELKGFVDVSGLGVDYVVTTNSSVPDLQPVFRNRSYAVFRIGK